MVGDFIDCFKFVVRGKLLFFGFFYFNIWNFYIGNIVSVYIYFGFVVLYLVIVYNVDICLEIV